MNGINAMSAMVNGTNGGPRGPENLEEMRTKLNTCIYDYFLRNEQFELAHALHKSQLSILTTKTAPPRKLNGEENGDDVKDDFAKKPQELPYPQDVPGGATDNCFLLDWFQIFWEMFFAPRKTGAVRPSPATAAYLHQQKEQQTMVRQNGMANGMMQGYPGMMRPGGPGAISMVGRGMQQNPNMRGPVNPAQQQQQQQQQLMLRQQAQQQQMIQNQQQMAREGSDIDMTDPNMLGQNQFNNFQGQNTKKNLDAYSQNVSQTLRQSMPGNMQGQMMGSQAGMEEFYNSNGAMRGGQMPGNGQAQGGQGNHALQDYQMQLMLLEQQNKKRLLMARQEQDQVRPGEQPMGGQAGYAPNMSPQGSRSGPSPNPSEQMKRGTPKMGPAGLPGGPNSPMPDQGMVHARNNSPGAMGFAGMDMMQPGMKGVEGMPMGPGMRPPSSHPGFNGGPNAAAQMEAIRAAQQGGRMPNGAGGWQMAQGQTQGMPQGQPGQQMGTPRQPNVNMPPPPVQNGVNGRPVSPTQSVAAGTPVTANKANPVKKGKAGKDTKKQPTKKGTTAATPSADNDPPQTPTPATPITPMHPNSFKDGKSVNGPQATTGQVNTNVSAPATQVPQAQQDMLHFEAMDGLETHGALNMHFGGMDTGDVLEQFDFDAFLDTGESDINFDTMANYGNFDGLEAGAGDA